MREVPQRELRNDVARVLRDVEAGEAVRVTVRGRVVAELVPPRHRGRTSPAEARRAIGEPVGDGAWLDELLRGRRADEDAEPDRWT